MSDVLELFTELAAIPSPPGQERAVADRVSTYLAGLALEVDEDDAGPRIGSDAGNLLARLPATSQNGGVAIFLCAHLDTVPPTAAIEPVVEDGVVRNAGGTILGADNKAAVATILGAARRFAEAGAPIGLELLFTTSEELAHLQGLPVKFLEGILTQLRRAGLIVSKRGAEGGSKNICF